MTAGAPIRIVQYGLGPIGLACARAVLSSERLRLVGAIDTDPTKVGSDLAALTGAGDPTGIVVSGDAARTLAEANPQVAIHTTASALEAIRGQLLGCAQAGVHVVSSSEELLYPFGARDAIARELDEAARSHGVALLGTGVNPGYVLDTLAVMATGVCLRVERLEARRVVDAGKRREPLQRKVGAGLTKEEFEARRRAGTIGHVGMQESLRFTAAGLGWKLERIEDDLEPVVAEARVETPFLTVEPGQVAGVHHATRGFVGDTPVLDLDLKMYVGAADPHDAVRVHGDPPIDLVIRGGVFGDTATVAALLNAAPRVLDAAPGLRTLLDLPIPRCLGVA